MCRMEDKVIYEFAIIRLVPKVEREEFINIGVILLSKEKNFLEIKYKIEEERIKCFSDELDLDMVEQYLQAWKAVCLGGQEGGTIGGMDISSRFRWLVASRSTIIQSSQPHPGMCHDPERVLADIFDKYVL